ncbi:hypothetical protein Tco_0407458 [Tanacetum coccineum]
MELSRTTLRVAQIGYHYLSVEYMAMAGLGFKNQDVMRVIVKRTFLERNEKAKACMLDLSKKGTTFQGTEMKAQHGNHRQGKPNQGCSLMTLTLQCLKIFEIVKAKGERKSLALKAKKESSDEECSTSESEDEEYAIAVRDFKKLFKRRECPKPSKDKNQRAFVGGSWSDSREEDDEKAKDETCLVAQTSNEKAKKKLENEISELKLKLSTLEKNKGVNLECTNCHSLKIDNEKLKEEALMLTQFEKSTHCLNEMLSNQKPSGDKLGLGFNSFEASTSESKEIKFVKPKKATVGLCSCHTDIYTARNT